MKKCIKGLLGPTGDFFSEITVIACTPVLFFNFSPFESSEKSLPLGVPKLITFSCQYGRKKSEIFSLFTLKVSTIHSSQSKPMNFIAYLVGKSRFPRIIVARTVVVYVFNKKITILGRQG